MANLTEEKPVKKGEGLNQLALISFLFILFGLFYLYLTFFIRLPVTISTLVFEIGYFFLFLPILAIIVFIKRFRLDYNPVKSTRIALYYILSIILLILCFLKTGTILLKNIPQPSQLSLFQKQVVTNKTSSKTIAPGQKPDVIELILDSSGSMGDPSRKMVENNLVINKDLYNRCLDNDEIRKADSDQDGLPDCLEEAIGSDSKKKDSDSDKKIDSEEFFSLQDPTGKRTMKMKYKLQEAKEALHMVIDQLPENQQVGLRIYSGNITKTIGKGNVSECEDSQLVNPIQAIDKEVLKQKVDMMQAKGLTPLSTSLERAATDFPNQDSLNQVIILVTDGVETCKRDPCQIASEIKKAGKIKRIDVIGIDIDKQSEKEIACIAQNGGGKYYSVSNINELETSLKQVVGLASFWDKLGNSFKVLLAFIPWIILILVVLIILSKLRKKLIK